MRAKLVLRNKTTQFMPKTDDGQMTISLELNLTQRVTGDYYFERGFDFQLSKEFVE